MKKTNPLITLSYYCSCLLLVFPAFGQQPEIDITTPEVSLLDRLQLEEMPALEIQFDFKTVFDDWKYQEYHPATATFATASGEEIIEKEIQLRSRGKFRSRHCASPPLKLKFKKSGLKQDGFNKWNEFKLVYPCQLGDDYQNYVLKEYLVYKLYNVLTEYSYRVQLVDLKLVDEPETESPRHSIGFLMEDLEELSDRMDMKTETVSGALPTELSAPDYTLLQVFQFAIANTDWTLAPCKNLDLVKTQDDRLIPVPYDFDFAGIVGAQYASIDRGLAHKTIGGRFFMGHDKSMRELMPVFEKFREHEEELFQIIGNFERLPEKERLKMQKHLRSFYDILKKPEGKLKKIFCQSLVEEGISNY